MNHPILRTCEAKTQAMSTSDPSSPQSFTSSPADCVVDARGLSCPLPLLRLRKALHGLAIDQSVQLWATDPHSQQDIRRYCEKSGQLLAQERQQDGAFGFWIVKKA